MNTQVGGGLTYYQSPVAFQRGHGLGGLLGKLIKTIVPLIRKPIVQKTIKRVGQRALQSGISAVGEKLSNPQSSLKNNLRKHALKEITRATQPRKRKLVLTPKGKRATLNVIRRNTKKKKTRKLDVFDFN